MILMLYRQPTVSDPCIYYSTPDAFLGLKSIHRQKASGCANPSSSSVALTLRKSTGPMVTSAAITALRDESEKHLQIQACHWQSKIALLLLAKKSLVSISATGSGKTITFWLPMMREKGLTIIITPLKSLGIQLAKESAQYGWHAVSVTAEALGESPNLIKVSHLLLRKVIL